MAIKVTFNGADVTAGVDSIEAERLVNERSEATVVMGDGVVLLSSVFEVIIFRKDGVTPWFGGIGRPRATNGASEGALENRTTIGVVSFWAYLDWCDAVTLSYSAPVALEDVVSDIFAAAALAGYGMTYTPPVTGIMVDPFSCVDYAVTALLSDLTKKHNRVFDVSPTKVLQIVTPGGTAAPVALTDANLHASDIRVGFKPEPPVTDVVLTCGPSGPALATQRWVADGVATSWVTDIEAADPPPALVMVDDGVTPHLATVGPGAQFEWDRPTHTLSLGTHPLPAAGTKLVLGPKSAAGDPLETDGYTAVFPFRVRSTTGATPKVVRRFARTDLVEYGPAVAIANGVRDALQEDARELEVVTDEDDFEPMQALTVDTTVREGIVGDFVINAVRLQVLGQDEWIYTFGADETPTYQGSYLDEWREAIGGGSGSGSTTLSPSTTTTVSTASKHAHPLGGTRNESLPVGVVQTPVRDWLPYTAPEDMSAVVHVTTKARVGSIAVTPVLTRWDSGSMTWVNHHVGSAITGLALEEKDQDMFTVLTAGDVYRLEFKTGTAGASAYCIGQVRKL